MHVPTDHTSNLRMLRAIVGWWIEKAKAVMH